MLLGLVLGVVGAVWLFTGALAGRATHVVEILVMSLAVPALGLKNRSNVGRLARGG